MGDGNMEYLRSRPSSRKRVSRSATVLAPSFLCGLVAACGGGGGGGSSPPPAASIATSPSSVTVSAAVNGTAPNPVTVGVSFSNAPSTVYFMASDYSTKGISGVSTPVYTAIGGSFVVSFKPPNGLQPASYADTDTLLLCSDPQCQSVLAKYPLAVTYTVTAASSAPQVTLDSASLNIQALSVDQGEVATTPDPSQFTFANFTAPPYVQLSAPTTGGISSLNFVMSDATHGGIAFVMQPPTGLGAGTYTTTIKAAVCLDSNCVNPVSGGSFTITLSYVIGNSITVAGVNGYTMTYFAVPDPAAGGGLVGFVANSQQNIIYLSISSSASSNAKTIEALDATSGAATYSASGLGGSYVLALSDDAQYLYTESATGIERLLASNLTSNLLIPDNFGGNFPLSIAVAPGEPQTFAVGGIGFLQIFDGAVMRPVSVQLPGADDSGVQGLEWGTDTLLYGQYNPGTGAPLPECSFTVDANGVTGPTSCSTTNLYPFNFAGDVGYADGGLVINPSNWATVATLSLPNVTIGTPLPDTTLGKLFAFASPTGSPNNLAPQIQSFDLTSYAPIASVRLPNLNYGNNPPLVRWGTNGLATLGSSSSGNTYVVVVSGGFVGP